MFICLCQSLVVTMNEEITFISSNVKGIQNSIKRIKISCRVAIYASKTIKQTNKISDKSGRILLVEAKLMTRIRINQYL